MSWMHSWASQGSEGSRTDRIVESAIARDDERRALGRRLDRLEDGFDELRRVSAELERPRRTFSV